MAGVRRAEALGVAGASCGAAAGGAKAAWWAVVRAGFSLGPSDPGLSSQGNMHVWHLKSTGVEGCKGPAHACAPSSPSVGWVAG